MTYVSLNYDNPDLHSIIPWYGNARLCRKGLSRPSSLSIASGR
jgi:hypothetical protein